MINNVIFKSSFIDKKIPLIDCVFISQLLIDNYNCKQINENKIIK